MKKIAPLFFIVAVLLSVWICVQIYRQKPAPPSGPPLTASATKGPLKLSLTLYSNHVPRNGPLWFRLTVANVGKKPFTFDYPLFATKFTYDGKDFIDFLNFGPIIGIGNDAYVQGIFLRVFNNKGKEVAQKLQTISPLMEIDPCLGYPPDSMQFETFPKAQRREFIRKTKAWWVAVAASKATFRHLVSPGTSIETTAWSYHGYCDGERKNPPTPPGRFAEFYGLDLSRPGHYRIFASLNRALTKKEREEETKTEQGALREDRRMGFKSDWYWHRKKSIPRAEDAVIQTPPIDFEVLP